MSNSDGVVRPAGWREDSDVSPVGEIVALALDVSAFGALLAAGVTALADGGAGARLWVQLAVLVLVARVFIFQSGALGRRVERWYRD